jgi:anaerobic selenocysteine-containing dehydrogenase
LIQSYFFNALLRKKSPDPQLDIHPETAARFGVADGEWVRLKTVRGQVEIRARFDGDMHPAVVHAPHGYWYGVKDGWERVNINIITDNQPWCSVSGSVPTRALLCTIEKM